MFKSAFPKKFCANMMLMSCTFSISSFYYAAYIRKDDHCGIVKMKGNRTNTRFRRIVGGRKSVPGDWPWQALLTVTGGKMSTRSCKVLDSKVQKL